MPWSSINNEINGILIGSYSFQRTVGTFYLKRFSTEFKNFIDSHSFFFVAGHKEPDGDAITSCLGVAAILEKMGKP